jgi:hypothetical protein
MAGGWWLLAVAAWTPGYPHNHPPKAMLAFPYAYSQTNPKAGDPMSWRFDDH